MATIDIDLEDFATDDLIAELSNRLSKKGMKRMSTKERTKVMEGIKDMSDSSAVLIIPLLSVDDQSKKEIILKAWDQCTSFQLEEKLT